MKNNLLVCGGVPRGGTTYLFTELSNYNNTFKSLIKESHVFYRDSNFIKKKIDKLKPNKIYLDFTPDYFFNINILSYLKTNSINSFFIIRDFDSWNISINNYLKINKIDDKYFLNMKKSHYLKCQHFIEKNFLTFHFNELKNIDLIKNNIEKKFNIDFGIKVNNKEKYNSSNIRSHFLLSFLRTYFRKEEIILKSKLFGLI